MGCVRRSFYSQIHPLRMLVAGTLCIALLDQPFAFASTSQLKPKHAKPIKGDDRILHALDRFTFGPQPGDVAAVKAMGLQRWFEQQLHPEKIDDSALEARLAQFPAMQLPQEDLMYRFPPPQVIRVMDRQKLPLPADPVERVIYRDQIAFEQMRQANKKDAPPQPNTMAMSQPQNVSANALAMASNGQVDKLYHDLDAMKVLNLQPAQRMQALLAMSPEALMNLRQSLDPKEKAQLVQGLSPEQREVVESLEGSERVVSGELEQTRLLRDIYSTRQLEAVMTDFWLNHFNIYVHKNQDEPFYLPAFERDVIRPNALGKFEDLLVATAKSSAMQMYLDNWQSLGPDSIAAQRMLQAQNRNPKLKGRVRPDGLNENYARELMELHTLGVNGGYTQADVIQVAKVFTGWTIEQPQRGGVFKFEPNRHEPGTKVVLGKTIQPSGEDEGMEVLHMLATSPATAHHVCQQLAVRFVSDDPPPALVNRMAKTFLKSDGDMKAVLLTLFKSPEFWSSNAYDAKVKTPLEFVVSAARATQADIKNPQPLVQALNRLGMPLYGMQTPNGYSWSSNAWVNTEDLINRMNFSLALASNRLPGVRAQVDQVFGQPASASFVRTSEESTLPAEEARLEKAVLGTAASKQTHDAVLRQMEPAAGTGMSPQPVPAPGSAAAQNQQVGTMVGLLLGSPDFQRR